MGFELFGLRVQDIVIGYGFTLVRKGYDYGDCHNKSKTENEAGVWMMSYPEEMG